MNLVDGKNSRIRLVYAYEDTENKYVYVGLTKNLSKRHYQHCHVMNGKKDRVFRYFENNNKTIPKPIVLDENLTREESQEKEGYWADYYAISLPPESDSYILPHNKRYDNTHN